MAMKAAKDRLLLQHVPGENMQQSCEGISIRVKGIELRSHAFQLICVQKMLQAVINAEKSRYVQARKVRWSSSDYYFCVVHPLLPSLPPSFHKRFAALS